MGLSCSTSFTETLNSVHGGKPCYIHLLLILKLALLCLGSIQQNMCVTVSYVIELLKCCLKFDRVSLLDLTCQYTSYRERCLEDKINCTTPVMPSPICCCTL